MKQCMLDMTKAIGSVKKQHDGYRQKASTNKRHESKRRLIGEHNKEYKQIGNHNGVNSIKIYCTHG